MSAIAAANPAPHPRISDDERRDIQGNLVGFNKDQQRLVFMQFADPQTAKSFLREIVKQLATAREVKLFNALFKELAIRGAAEGTVQASWLNLALSAKGLELLQAPGLADFPVEFRQGMAAAAATLGDVGANDPASWLPPFNEPATVHAMAIIASDNPADLDVRYAQLKALMNAHGVIERGQQNGNTRPGEARGREHFGFKDGISQPGIAGLTESSKAGQETIAAGEFLIGHPNQDGTVSGAAEAAAPGPVDPYAPAPPQPEAALPDWAKNGSFLVYRRLRQDVAAFQQFVAAQANPAQLGAKLVGRWPSGAPMEPVPGFHGSDPSVSDPATSDPSMLKDAKINRFDFSPGDDDGSRVPHAAHIRKVNPRSANPHGGRADTNRHRILRRGIPYGTEFVPGNEGPYGPAVDPAADRGLLFICYQASIRRGFAFTQQAWANAPDFPQPGDGQDPIISQSVEPRQVRIPPAPEPIPMAQWVKTTGGEYFFSPSISAFQTLTA